jgi:hypothetical protein
VRPTLSGAIAIAILLVLETHAASARGATITVNDQDFLGAVGDNALSISEAIRLATGDLDVATLSPAERQQVRGQAGAGRSDVIRFLPGLTISVRRRDQPLASILPPLTDAGDAIVGNGTVLDGSPMDGQPQPSLTETFAASDTTFGRVSMAPLLVVSASVEVPGLHVDQVVGANLVVTSGPRRGVKGVLIHDNVLTGIDDNVPVTGIAVTGGGGVSGQRLSDVLVRGNRIDDMGLAIAVLAGAAGDGEEASNNVAEGIHIVGNTIERATEAIIMGAATSSLGGSVTDNVLRRTVRENNIVSDAFDTGIFVGTTDIVDGVGTAARNSVIDTQVRRNRIVATPNGRMNLALFISGAQVVESDGGTAENDHLDTMAITSNVFDGMFAGAVINGGYGERCAHCSTTNSVVENVHFHGNTWRNLQDGLIFQGQQANETAAVVQGNTVRNVTVRNDDIKASDSAVVLQGGSAGPIDPNSGIIFSGMQFPGFHEPGTIADGSLVGVTFTNNRIEAPQGVTLIGGSNLKTEDTVTGGTVQDVTFRRNMILGSGITVIGGVVTTSGVVTQSRVQHVSGSGNVGAGGAAVAVVTVNQLAVGAPADSVQDNSVVDVTIK